MIVGRRVPVANLDDVASADDRVIPGPDGDVPVRIYRPHGDSGPRPAVVFCHGGGFVLCDLDSHDGFCRAMSRHTGTVVVSVDYRLAPEHRAPAAVQDVYAAFCWVIAHADELGIDPARVLIAGDSAGGNLAAVTALLCREQGTPPPVGQVLIYPVIDPSFDTEQLSDVRQRVRQHLDGDAVVLAAVPRRRRAAVTCVSGCAGARRIARGPAARGRRDRGSGCPATVRAHRMRSSCVPRKCLWCIAITRVCSTAS